ncbi:MAG: S8 family serine peptidase [Chloroflexi bacterium]|nr:S8 family serine peptidase [Chloroflexota bacterium]
MNRFRLSRLLLSGLLFATLISTNRSPLTPVINAAAPDQSNAATTKILLANTASATQSRLLANQAQLLQTYEHFSLWQVPTTQLERLSIADAQAIQTRPDFDLIYLRNTTINTQQGQAAVPSALRQTRSNAGQYWLVQFVGPTKTAWLEQLTALGLEISVAMPQNGFLVWGDGASLALLDRLVEADSFVQWAGPYHPAYRIAPALQAQLTAVNSNGLDVTLQLHSGSGSNELIKAILAQATSVYLEPSKVLNFINLSVQLPTSVVAELVQHPALYNLEPWSAPELLDEVQNQLVAGNITVDVNSQAHEPSGPGYLAWLASKGFSTDPADYPIVNLVDSGLDQGSPTTGLSPDFYQLGSTANPSRIVAMNNCTRNPDTSDVDGHGTLNAGIIAGYNAQTGAPYVDAAGYSLGLGVAPYGRLAITQVIRDGGPFELNNCGKNYQGLVGAGFATGATITNNSWGMDSDEGLYDSAAQAYDALTRDASSTTAGNQEMLHVFAVGNSHSEQSVDSPASAKNVLAVGATESVRDHGIADICGYDVADNAADIAAFSAAGPTADQRIKPDLLAPGIHIQAQASQNPGYDGSSFCSFDPVFYPAGQTTYTWSSGTSVAAPAVAGAAALASEYYGRVLNPGRSASPAMLKALLLNSPRYLAAPAERAGGNLPTIHQGWGAVNLQALVDGTPQIVEDQLVHLQESGEGYQLSATISDSSKPLRLSLVWSDAPGSTTGAAYVNDLDLEVLINGQTYRGNVFDGAFSVSGGTADARNNVENIFLPAGMSGQIQVKVIATALNGDGIPNNADATDQDFALVVYNATTTPAAHLQAEAPILSAVIGNANGLIEPGETLDLAIPLTNHGNANATAVQASLQVLSGTLTISNPTVQYGLIEPSTTVTATQAYRISMPVSAGCGAQMLLRQTVSFNNGQTVAQDFSFVAGSAILSSPTRVSYSGTSIGIPDDPFEYVTVPLSVSQSLTIADLNVLINIRHGYVADLDVALIAPDGTAINLTNDNGFGGDHFINTEFDDQATQFITAVQASDAPFTGRYRPEEPLSRFNGHNSQGIWTLQINDDTEDDSGTFVGFSLDFASAAYQCQPSGLSISGPAHGLINQPVNLAASLASAPIGVEYQWDFGDGQQANGASVSHAYSSNGTYTVAVTATNALGTTTATHQITIDQQFHYYLPLVVKQP